MRAGRGLRQRRLLGHRADRGRPPDGDVNRAVEAAVAERGGHKSLYSDAYYDEATFAAIYGGDGLPSREGRATIPNID